MKRLMLALVFLPGLLVVIFLLTQVRWKWSKSGAPIGAAAEAVSRDFIAQTLPAGAGLPSGGTNVFLGEQILRGYAATDLPPQNDLTLMSRLMENALLLLKSAANRPLSANEDWADFFRGRNAAQEMFLPANHAALNTNGQLVDRWSTPLFFHALGGGRYEIRSAGPDRKLWTADDLHRNADGSFRRGGELIADDLVEAANRARRPATGP